jgi:hypothetical protein
MNRFVIIFALLANASVCAAPRKQDLPAPPSDFVEWPAVFEVTTDVVNPALEPFTVTAGSFGSNLKLPVTFQE